jgi:light-regulated signal transduction histidine kinase (bacteriophytochrome)
MGEAPQDGGNSDRPLAASVGLDTDDLIDDRALTREEDDEFRLGDVVDEVSKLSRGLQSAHKRGEAWGAAVCHVCCQNQPRTVHHDRGSRRGVTEEFVGSLFERFTRGVTRSSEGAGLGLSIAQSYARAHGGTLTYEPAKPHGAIFRLVLPVAAP